MPERIYRDPVHNIIRLQTDSDEGELMMRLIDAAEFQRLRRIKQLGLGLYTYQGAEHSRFTHSLGAFHLMTRVLDRLVKLIDRSRRSHCRTRRRAASRRGPWLFLTRDGEGAQLSSRTLDRASDPR
jgi:HD superfamily phosphohydrolase